MILMNDAKKITFADVIAYLDSVDRAERSRVNEHILFLAREDDAKKRSEFRFGDKVKFRVTKGQYRGLEVVGTVNKRNPRTIEVQVIGGSGPRFWRVSPALLQKA